ncbi:MAG: carboxylesterase family protein [Bacteroidales bacterium]|nr:carboxylesterase family protein [Bacteroidales bacterium]
MRKSLLAIAILAAALTGCKTKNPVLTIEGGQIQGVETSVKGVYVYKGVPFAAPPVGDLRWKEPQPVIPWQGVKVADTFSAGAVQSPHDSSNPWTSEFYMTDPEFSEDCLYLNVWTPAPGQTDKKLPVAMWIHGGGYTGGWSWEPEFDGKVWAQKGVVLVTINYRLGIFGFLTHPLLAAESPHGVSGNYGILDQIAALKWIANNIEQFGGDPDNITILGQSAGAGSVKTLCESPLTGNLIKKAIIQSGGGVSEPRPAGAQQPPQGFNMPAAPTAQEIFEWAGYDTLEKMRAASTEDIFTLASRYSQATGRRANLSTRPNIDNYVSTKSFDAAAFDGTIKNIPYMIGYTRDDMGNGSPQGAIDLFCSLRNKAGKPVYAYQFARPLPDDAAGSHDMKGAFHSSELWFMFKSLDHSDRPFTQGDWELAERIITHWTNFAKTGDPGNGWKAFTQDAPDYMVFKVSEDEKKDASAMGKPVARGI